MILITSAAYVNPGLASEFGKIPPCMLPVQNRRLYEHQIHLVSKFKGEKIVISLPSQYVVPKFDIENIKRLGADVISVPEELSLGESVVYALNVSNCNNEPLRILHGDTLFCEIDDSTDIYAIAKVEYDYDWANVHNDSGSVYAGFFAFSHPSLLIQKITENRYDFIKGVEGYSCAQSMSGLQFKGWMDFGLVNSYYRSISQMTTQRAFNSIEISPYSVRKKSKDCKKILAEANWFSCLPASMRHYAPSLWDWGVDGEYGFYEIEYYYLSSLASLFVFGKNPLFVWDEIIDACASYLKDEYSIKPAHPKTIAIENDSLYAAKTISRLLDYCEMKGIDANKPWKINGVATPSLIDIISEVGQLISKEDEKFATLMHGDFCFSNILYDFKSKSIKVIDPRGLDSRGNQTIYGDIRYDVAKLAHSVIGLYDFIIGGMFYLEEVSPYEMTISFPTSGLLAEIQECFMRTSFAGHTQTELSTVPIVILLFLSMLPLHYDDSRRQNAMLANALRLYVELKKGTYDV